MEEVSSLIESAEDGAAPLRWLCLDAAVIPDIDYSGAETLRQVHGALADHDIRFVMAEVMTSVRGELERYGLVELLGEDAFYETISDIVAAYRATTDTPPRST